MKKLLLLSFFTLALTGCSLFSGDTPTSVEGDAQPPVKIHELPLSTVDNFFVESGETGLILKLNTNKNFVQQLSNESIESVEIADGILTFIEITNAGSRTQVFNLNELVQVINQP